MFAKIYFSLSTSLVGAIATSGNAHGVFADAGPISVFVSNHVLCVPLPFNFLRPSANTIIFEINETNSVSSSYRQILNGIPTPPLPNKRISKIK